MISLKYITSTQISDLKAELINLDNNKGINSVLVLSGAHNNYDEKQLNNLLKSYSKPIFGGHFPGIIYENECYETGSIIVGLEYIPEIIYCDDIEDEDLIENTISKSISKFSEMKTLFVFVDSLSRGVDLFIQQIFIQFGLKYNYIGGGAGSLDFITKPCIYTNDGVKKNCGLIIGLNKPSGIGVKHGWGKIAGPFKVSKSNLNQIIELDYKNAFNVYQEEISKHSNKYITENNFFEIAKSYPFGITKFDSECIVRDPIKVTNEIIECVGVIKTGIYVNILHGDCQMLLDAAEQAIKKALYGIDQNVIEFTFIVDCISRSLFLEKEFIKELNSIKTNIKSVPLFGVLSIGEIANNGKEYMDFYNKTIVIACV